MVMAYLPPIILGGSKGAMRFTPTTKNFSGQQLEGPSVDVLVALQMEQTGNVIETVGISSGRPYPNFSLTNLLICRRLACPKIQCQNSKLFSAAVRCSGFQVEG